MSRHFVVVQDREIAEGGILESEAAAQQVEGRGGIVLPYDIGHALVRDLSASTAYQRRAYGAQGFAFDGRAPTRGCPFPVFMSAESVRVAWAASVSNVGANDGFHLASAIDEGGLSADVSTDKWGRIVRMPDGDIAIGGSSIVRGQVGRFAVLCLLGNCADLRVMWLAATVLPR